MVLADLLQDRHLGQGLFIFTVCVILHSALDMFKLCPEITARS